MGPMCAVAVQNLVRSRPTTMMELRVGLVDIIVARTEDEQRYVRYLADSVQDFETVHARHRLVEQDKVRLLVEEHVQSCLAVAAVNTVASCHWSGKPTSSASRIFRSKSWSRYDHRVSRTPATSPG